MREAPSIPVVEASEERVKAAISRLQADIDKGGETEHLKLALFGLSSYLQFCKILSSSKATIHGLRKLLGIPTPFVQPPPPKDKDKDKSCTCGSGKGHGKRGCEDFPDAEKRYFAHPDFSIPGCSCPKCLKGKVYPGEGGFPRFEGQPFLKIILVIYEIWRCNLCQEVFPAPIAHDLLLDGGKQRTFGFSATAMIALVKYFFGTPWFRVGRLQDLLGLPVSASTLCDQSKTLAVALSPIYELLFIHAAEGWLFYSDDTGIKILSLRAEIKIQRTTQKETVRSGVHTSCIISELSGGGRIILFKSGILHAGEFLDEVLGHRNPTLPPPLHMSDGSSCNPATVTDTIPAACNSHAKRKLDEKKDLYPEHQAFMKSIYKKVYKNDKHTKEKKMTPLERLAYHQEHSLPLMEKLFQWMKDEMENKNVEPNSILGGIFNYFLQRQQKLIAFTKYEGAPLDNNTLEQALKLIALLRKNAMFFKTLAGAKNADAIMSLGATAGTWGVNLDHYFTSCLRYQEEVKKNPEAFLPWNYLKTVEELDKKAELNFHTVQELTEKQWVDRQERFAQSKIRPFPKSPPNTGPTSHDPCTKGENVASTG